MNSKNDFKPVFQSLKSIFAPYAEELVLEIDTADNYYLNTHFIMKNKKPMYFGSVKINKKYVSFHLMPVYSFPELLENLSPELKKRMQGKSCFNFTETDENLFKELGMLTSNGYEKYDEAGYL